MNVDLEFFNIVEQLGPMGDIELESFRSHPATNWQPGTDHEGCGCGDGAACESELTTGRLKGGTFPGLAPGGVEADVNPFRAVPASEGPADPSVTPFPKWDPATRSWWVWDDANATWLRKA